MTKRVPSPLKVHGGKSPLAAKIVALLPRHRVYAEVFAGGLSVLLAKDPTDTAEVVNDLNKGLTNFWRVLQEPAAFALLQRRLEATPFSEWEWQQSNRRLLLEEIDVAHAADFFVHCRQSLAGRGQSFAPVSTSRLRRGQCEQVSAWLTAVEGLPAVHRRLQRVLILNRDALDVIRQYDKPGVCIYCDSPYPAETRASPSVYTHEMTTEQHRQYLDAVLATTAASVAVSGYHCREYDDRLQGWELHEFDCALHSAGGTSKQRKTECLWIRRREYQQ